MPYHDDDGIEQDPTTIPMPQMCRICEKRDDPHEQILCELNGLDQRDERSSNATPLLTFTARL